jgi:hypothetical protein
MDSSDHRPSRADDDLKIQSSSPSVLSYSITGVGAGTGSAFHQPLSPGTLPGYTLMVAGQRTGKTSFLRLLLDTSDISQMATKDQLASIAKFVQGSSGHTSHIRTASFDIELDAQFNSASQRLTLSLVDTPSLDFSEETSAERLVSELLRHVDSRFAEGLEDVSLSLHVFHSPFLPSALGSESPGRWPSRSSVHSYPSSVYTGVLITLSC